MRPKLTQSKPKTKQNGLKRPKIRPKLTQNDPKQTKTTQTEDQTDKKRPKTSQNELKQSKTSQNNSDLNKTSQNKTQRHPKWHKTSQNELKSKTYSDPKPAKSLNLAGTNFRDQPSQKHKLFGILVVQQIVDENTFFEMFRGINFRKKSKKIKKPRRFSLQKYLFRLTHYQMEVIMT